MSNLINAAVPDRPLVAYAFLAQTSYTDGDLLSALAPIFKPIAKTKEGSVFDPNDFAKAVAKVFGIQVHPWAVEDLAPRLQRAGLLKQTPTSGTTHQYIYAPVTESFSDVTESDIRGVVEKFIAFCEPILDKHSIPVDRKALEEGFLDQLVKMDFMAILVKPDRSKEDQKGSGTISLPKSTERIESEKRNAAQAQVDVLSASFILHVYREDRALYEFLVRITSGALLAEVVLNFQDPGNTTKLDRLKVVLDAPFLMSLLDLASEESHKYAKLVLDSLIEHGASIATFRHYTEEIKHNLLAVIQETAAGRGFRATSRRLSGQAFQRYAAAVAQDVPQALTEINVRIIDPPTSTASYQYFSQELEDQFYGTLGTYNNQHAQRRDAETIAGIMRLRSNKRVRMNKLQLADYLFVTDNAFLVHQSSVFLKARKLYEDGDVPPATTDKHLAGLLWVIYGGKGEELSRNRLLANCAAALDLRPDVVSRTYRFLSETDASKAERFRALMTTERASQHLMQLTLGDSMFVSKENVIELLDEIEKEYEDKHRKVADARINEVLEEKSAEMRALEITKNAEYEALRQSNEDLKNRALEAATELLLSREATKQAARATAQVDEERKREQDRRMGVETTIVERCAKGAIQRESQIHIGLAIAAAGLVGGIGYLSLAYATEMSDNAIALSVLLGAVAGLGFWKAPDYLFGNLVTGIRHAYFKSLLQADNASSLEIHYDINWKTGKANPKRGDFGAN